MTDGWEIAGVLVGGITSVSSTLIAFIALQLVAKPRIRVNLADPPDRVIYASRPFRMSFSIQNRGRWFAHPAATGLRLYFNFQPEFLLTELQYGGNPPFITRNVHNGKRGAKYLVAKNIRVTYGEDAEDVVVIGSAPPTPGLYCCWISAFSNEGMDQRQRYQVNVR